ncbi:MAG: glutathione S-transferase N-terminal domain-containing protein [Pseudomonadota bacterium]
MTVRIWGRATSINVQKALWLCGEIELSVERVDLGGAFGGLDTADYLAMNPNGRVPTLQDGDLILWESNAILRHLARTRAPHLLGGSDAERAQVDMWLDWQQTTLWAQLRPLFRALVRPGPDTAMSTSDAAAATQAVTAAMTALERRLDARAFILGGGFSLPDVAIGLCAHRWLNLELSRPDTPAVRRWYDAITARRAFQALAPPPLS